MARAAKLKPPSLVLLGTLLVIGGLTLGLGLKTLSDIRQIYRPEDLAYSETPQTFRLWFLAARRQATSDDALTVAVARRLRIMRIDKRRAVVNALMSDPYLESLLSDRRDRRRNLGILLGGVLQALSSSPLEGDLWSVAARLRRRLSGFDEEAERYLQASFRYTPREIYLVVDRLLLASQVALVLSPETLEQARRDQQFLNAFPDQVLVKSVQEQLRSVNFSAR